MGHPRPLFDYFRSFQTIYRINTVGFSGIRTRIVGVEGEHADHLTTTTDIVRCERKQVVTLRLYSFCSVQEYVIP